HALAAGDGQRDAVERAGAHAAAAFAAGELLDEVVNFNGGGHGCSSTDDGTERAAADDRGGARPHWAMAQALWNIWVEGTTGRLRGRGGFEPRKYRPGVRHV